MFMSRALCIEAGRIFVGHVNHSTQKQEICGQNLQKSPRSAWPAFSYPRI